MTVKRIQLRGISRTPSDRMNADGGLAESLNLQVEDGELKPLMQPSEVMYDEGFNIPNDTSYEIIFLHKSNYFTHTIVKSGSNFAWVDALGEPIGINISGVGEFRKCIGFGNTVGFIFTESVEWAVFRADNYVSLGRNTPFPKFTLTNYVVDSEFNNATPEGNYDGVRGAYRGLAVANNLDDFQTIAIFPPLSNGKISDRGENSNWYQQYVEPVDNSKLEFNPMEISTFITTKNNWWLDQTSGELYHYKQFAIIAINILGERIISEPILLNQNGFIEWDYKYEKEITQIYGTDKYNVRATEVITEKPTKEYKIWLQLNEDKDFFEDWKDIISDIEIYLSEQIYEKVENATYTEEKYFPDTVGSTEKYIYTGKIRLTDNPEQDLLDRAQFFKVKSYNLKKDKAEIEKLFSGVVLDTEAFIKDEVLKNQEPLDTISDMRKYDITFDHTSIFNNKILASGVSESIQFDSKHYFPINSFSNDTDVPDEFKVTIFFHLRTAAGKEVHISTPLIDIKEDYTIPNGKENPVPYGFIICPDSRAFLADVIIKTNDEVKSFTVRMKPHPYLNCSYWYGDLTKRLDQFDTDYNDIGDYELSNQSVLVDGHYRDLEIYALAEEKVKDSIPNKLYVSSMDLPFVFPLTGRHTFSGNVIGSAIATSALSTGQFGQFPVYVFTDDGIWAMDTAADGSFLSSRAVSRDACANAESITPIDNAVVFVTNSAVMLISGSEVINLSPNMNGKHFSIGPKSDEYKAIQNGGDWEEFLPTLEDDTHFMAFVKEAFIVYDYNGKRLIFFNKYESYQYVYSLTSKTWHKMYFGGTFERSLSNYPDAYVSVSKDGENKIMKLSTDVDITSTDSVKGVIVTRSIDLDEPDVRKSIKAIRIRGNYKKGNVKYILIGSNDTINWQMLGSLRGGSYKFFRIIILADLSVNERISWIDIEYESRYNNKLR